MAVLYFESVTGSYAAGMSVFSIMALTTVVFEIPTGILSDRMGRKNTMILVALAELGGIACFAFADDYLTLLTGGILYGIAQALFSGNAEALLYESLVHYRKKSRYADVLGRVSSMTQAALALASLGAAIMLGMGVTLRFLVLLSLVPVFFGFLTALLMHEPPHSKKTDGKVMTHFLEAAGNVWRNPQLRWLSFANSLHYGVGSAANNFMPGFIASVWPLWATSFLRFIQNTLGAVSFWFAGKTVQRFGALRVLCGGTLAMNGLHIIALLITNVFSPILISVSQVFYAVNTVSSSTLLQAHFSDVQRATMGSIISFGTRIVQAVFAVFIGFMADLTNPATALLIVMIIRLPAPFIFWRLLRAS